MVLLEVKYIYPRVKEFLFFWFVFNTFTASNNRHPLLYKLLWNISFFAEKIKILFCKFFLTVKVKYKICSCRIFRSVTLSCVRPVNYIIFTVRCNNNV